MSKRLQITFDVDVPDVGASEEQVEQWIRFRLGNIHEAHLGELWRYSVDPLDLDIKWLRGSLSKATMKITVCAKCGSSELATIEANHCQKTHSLCGSSKWEREAVCDCSQCANYHDKTQKHGA